MILGCHSDVTDGMVDFALTTHAVIATLGEELLHKVTPCREEPGVHGSGILGEDAWEFHQDTLQRRLLREGHIQEYARSCILLQYRLVVHILSLMTNQMAVFII